jgi:hypothetical protein
MAKGDFKADPRAIVYAHWGSYIDARTGHPRRRDQVVIDGLPVLAGLIGLWRHLHLPSPASVGLLTVSGLLSAFLFALMLQVADRASGWADTHPTPSRETSQRVTYLTELAANAGYTSLISIAAAITFVIASACSKGWPLLAFSCVGVALGVHLVLTMMMVMKRVFGLTQDQLQRVRTGAS